MVEWNNRKSFYLDFHIGLESNDYIIWQRLGFDEFTLTLIWSGLKIEELNHTGSCTKRFAFSSDGLPPYTARCHWWILGAIRMILMIDHSNCLNQKSSDPLKGVSMMSMMRSRHISLPYRIKPNWITQTRVRIWMSSIGLTQLIWIRSN